MSDGARSATDRHVRRLREQISDNDRAIVDAINKRLKLVSQLASYKVAHDIPFLDPEREEWMLRYLQRANRGPLSQAGLERIFRELLRLTKREVVPPAFETDGPSVS